MVPATLRKRQEGFDRDTKLLLFRSIGSDGVGAIERVFQNLVTAPRGGLAYDGHDLTFAWRFRIETGKASPQGFKNEVYAHT